MFWGKGKGDKDGRDEPRPEVTEQAPRQRQLPHKLQQLVDREDDNDELSSQ